MSAKKKDNEDSVVIFKQEPGQSKDDAWMFFDAKVIGAANNLHPDHAPFLLQQYDGKLPDWGLNSNVFFKKLWDKSRQYHPGKTPKESSYTDASTGVLRQGEYDAAMRHWQNRSDKFLEHKDNMAKDYQKAQGWLYRLLCTSFAQTNLTKIQIYEPNTFRDSLMKENPALTVEDLRIQFMPYGSLLWNAIKPEYVQSGSSSLIIHMSGWTTLTGVGFQELLKKSNETVAIQKYAQEAEMKWQRCSKFYEKLDPATIASMQVLMGVYAYGSDSLRMSVQEIFRELDNGQNMTVTEVSKKLYTMSQVEEAKDHL